MTSLFGEYAILTLEISGVEYEFYLPASQLEKLVILETDDGLIIVNNSGSTITLQGVPNYTSTDIYDYYQLTLPASNLASNQYRYGGFNYVSTYTENSGYTGVTTENEYFSSPVSGSLQTSPGTGGGVVSDSSFYSYTMAMLLFIAAMVAGLFWKWRVKLHD